MGKKIKGYVFDIGNVLVSWSPSNITKKYFDGSTSNSHNLNQVTEEMNLRIDKGEPFQEVIKEYINKYPKFEEVLLDWRDNWIQMFQPKITGTWLVLEELKKMGSPVYALSNFGKETFELACHFYPELKSFNFCFISGYLGLVKPNEKIYELVEEKSGFRSGELFFVDDRIDNCRVASERGWIVHRFTNPQRLRDHLNSLGIRLKS